MHWVKIGKIKNVLILPQTQDKIRMKKRCRLTIFRNSVNFFFTYKLSYLLKKNTSSSDKPAKLNQDFQNWVDLGAPTDIQQPQQHQHTFQNRSQFIKHHSHAITQSLHAMPQYHLTNHQNPTRSTNIHTPWSRIPTPSTSPSPFPSITPQSTRIPRGSTIITT